MTTYLATSTNPSNCSPMDTIGIPIVADATERDTVFPDPEEGQRVHNVALGTIQRYASAAWVTDFISSTAVSTALSGVQSTCLSAAASAAGA